jgi:hypothetical protein
MNSPLTTGFYIKKKYYIVSANLEKNAKIREKRKQTLVERLKRQKLSS